MSFIIDQYGTKQGLLGFDIMRCHTKRHYIVIRARRGRGRDVLGICLCHEIECEAIRIPLQKLN